MSENEPAKGSDPANVIAFIKDLTFEEIHAFTWGFGFVGAAVLATVNGRPEVATAFYLAYTAVLGRAMLGESLRQLLPNVTLVNVPAYVIRQVRRELHYYLFGGATAYALQHAPDAIDTVLRALPTLPF